MFQILAATDLGIHILADEDNHHRNQDAQSESHQSDVLLDRSGRLHAAGWRGNDPGIVGGECLRQLVLLTLLQQEQVEGFLHLLLAFHRQEVLALGGIGCNPGRGLPFTLPQGA